MTEDISPTSGAQKVTAGSLFDTQFYDILELRKILSNVDSPFSSYFEAAIISETVVL